MAFFAASAAAVAPAAAAAVRSAVGGGPWSPKSRSSDTFGRYRELQTASIVESVFSALKVNDIFVAPSMK